VNISNRSDNTAVTCVRPALVSEGFSSACLYFEAKGADTVRHTSRKPTFPPFPHDIHTDSEGRAAGFFHTESIDGIDWVVGPSGAAFFITGTDHVNYNGMWCEALGYSPHKRNAGEQYENKDAWAASAAERLDSCRVPAKKDGTAEQRHIAGGAEEQTKRDNTGLHNDERNFIWQAHPPCLAAYECEHPGLYRYDSIDHSCEGAGNNSDAYYCITYRGAG
jgi:hypothetical protein